MRWEVVRDEINTLAAARSWADQPVAAVFEALDLSELDALLAGALPSAPQCAFLGCHLGPLLAATAAELHCTMLPPVSGLVFAPYHPHLYTPDELYDRFDPDRPASYRDCLDWTVYESLVDPLTRRQRPADVELALFRRIHDASITDALDELLNEQGRQRCVAVMGGHDVLRNSQTYAEIAQLGWQLGAAGYVVLTGGGPGLMEAANLGAFCAGFADPSAAIERSLNMLRPAPRYDHPDWLATAWRARSALGAPDHRRLSLNIGIPTWFYGHEPPNVFATHIAKYFENSVREEGLLAAAVGGLIVAPGNAGTVQEIFQDACQNYYRAVDGTRSPMILLGSDYWTIDKPVWPLLQALAAERGFANYVTLTDDLTGIVEFLRSHPPERDVPGH